VRYLVAGSLGVAIVVSGAAFVILVRTHFRRALAEELRSLRLQRDAGERPTETQGVDIDALDPSGMGVELSRGQIVLVTVADWLVSFWYVWVLLVMAGACGIAWLTKSRPNT
jgi:hypothetical protein